MKGCKLRTTHKLKYIYIKASRKTMLKYKGRLSPFAFDDNYLGAE
jgi:hypothetical protein